MWQVVLWSVDLQPGFFVTGRFGGFVAGSIGVRCFATIRFVARSFVARRFGACRFILLCPVILSSVVLWQIIL